MQEKCEEKNKNYEYLHYSIVSSLFFISSILDLTPLPP